MRRKPKFTVLDILTVLLVLGGMLIFHTCFLFATVNGESMSPTINSGDYLLYLKTKDYTRNDIIAFKYEDKYLVKRVIGISGDSIKFKDFSVYLNNNLLTEDYINTDNILYYGSNSVTYIVPSESCYVLGDNRAKSYDSRSFGVVNTSQVVGKVIFNFSDISLSCRGTNFLFSCIICLIFWVQVYLYFIRDNK